MINILITGVNKFSLNIKEIVMGKFPEHYFENIYFLDCDIEDSTKYVEQLKNILLSINKNKEFKNYIYILNDGVVTEILNNTVSKYTDSNSRVCTIGGANYALILRAIQLSSKDRLHKDNLYVEFMKYGIDGMTCDIL